MNNVKVLYYKVNKNFGTEQTEWEEDRKKEKDTKIQWGEAGAHGEYRLVRNSL